MLTVASATLLLKLKCFNTINLLFQMDTEGGGTGGGDIGEETDLNILQGFDFDQNHEAESEWPGVSIISTISR